MNDIELARASSLKVGMNLLPVQIFGSNFHRKHNNIEKKHDNNLR